jgi:hypothetical protein
MKKLASFLTGLIMVALIMFAIAPLATAATNTVYNVAASTFPITEATTHTDITKGYIGDAHVYIKQIKVDNTTATAQTIYVYKNTNSTSTATLVTQISIPATIGNYNLFPMGMSNVFTNADLIDIPYFGIRGSTSTNPANITVIYVK